MLSQQSKQMLKNIIRHTDTHNRLEEEKLMWEMWKGKKSKVSDKHSRRKNKLKIEKCGSSSSSDYSSTRLPTSHDVYRGTVNSNSRANRSQMINELHADALWKKNTDSDHQGNDFYWTQKLTEYEENAYDRWGHSGYKTLYPEEFEKKSPSLAKTVDVALTIDGHKVKKQKRLLKKSKHKKSSKHDKSKIKKQKKKDRKDVSKCSKKRKHDEAVT